MRNSLDDSHLTFRSWPADANSIHQDSDEAAQEVALSGDGSTLAVANKDGTVEVWDYNSQKLLHTFEPGIDTGETVLPARRLALDKTGNNVIFMIGRSLVNLRRGALRPRKATRSNEFTEFFIPAFVRGNAAAVLSPDGYFIAFKNENGQSLGVYSHEQDQLYETHLQKPLRIAKVFASPDSSKLVLTDQTTSDLHIVKLFNLSNKRPKEISRLVSPFEQSDAVISVQFASETPDLVMALYNTGHVATWSLSQGRVVSQLSIKDQIIRSDPESFRYLFENDRMTVSDIKVSSNMDRIVATIAVQPIIKNATVKSGSSESKDKPYFEPYFIVAMIDLRHRSFTSTETSTVTLTQLPLFYERPVVTYPLENEHRVVVSTRKSTMHLMWSIGSTALPVLEKLAQTQFLKSDPYTPKFDPFGQTAIEIGNLAGPKETSWPTAAKYTFHNFSNPNDFGEWMEVLDDKKKPVVKKLSVTQLKKLSTQTLEQPVLIPDVHIASAVSNGTQYLFRGLPKAIAPVKKITFLRDNPSIFKAKEVFKLKSPDYFDWSNFVDDPQNDRLFVTGARTGQLYELQFAASERGTSRANLRKLPGFHLMPLLDIEGRTLSYNGSQTRGLRMSDEGHFIVGFSGVGPITIFNFKEDFLYAHQSLRDLSQFGKEQPLLDNDLFPSRDFPFNIQDVAFIEKESWLVVRHDNNRLTVVDTNVSSWTIIYSNHYEETSDAEGKPVPNKLHTDWDHILKVKELPSHD